MTAPLEVRQELVDALQLDLVGPTGGHWATRRKCSPRPRHGGIGLDSWFQPMHRVLEDFRPPTLRCSAQVATDPIELA
jgi:hypothetical protein